MERGSASYHNYKDFYAFNNTNRATTQSLWKAYHTVDGGMSIPNTDKMTASTGAPSGWGTLTWGSSVAEDSTSNGYWGTVTFALCKNTDGLDYSVCQWGNNTTTSIWTGSETATFDKGSELTKTLSSSSYKSSKYAVSNLEKTDQINTLPAHTLKWYKPSLIPVSYKINQFYNNYLSAVAGEDVKLGGGAPIVTINTDEQTIKLKLKVKSTKSGTSTVNVKFSDKQFVDGDFATGAKHFYDSDLQTGVESPEIQIQLTRNEKVWINMYDTTSGYDAAIDTLTLN